MKKKKFSQEFSQNIVDYYYKSGKSVCQVSEETGIALSTLNRWISNTKKSGKKIEHRRQKEHSTNNKDEEIAILKKKLKDTQDALIILKKAIRILNNWPKLIKGMNSFKIKNLAEVKKFK